MYYLRCTPIRLLNFLTLILGIWVLADTWYQPIPGDFTGIKLLKVLFLSQNWYRFSRYLESILDPAFFFSESSFGIGAYIILYTVKCIQKTLIFEYIGLVLQLQLRTAAVEWQRLGFLRETQRRVTYLWPKLEPSDPSVTNQSVTFQSVSTQSMGDFLCTGSAYFEDCRQRARGREASFWKPVSIKSWKTVGPRMKY